MKKWHSKCNRLYKCCTTCDTSHTTPEVFHLVVPNFASNKAVAPWMWTRLFRHGDAKVGGICTATWWGCRIKQNWLMEPVEAHVRADEQTPALICDSCARRILRAAAIIGGYFSCRQQNSPPNIWGRNLKSHIEILSSQKISPPPLHNFGLRHPERETPLPNPSFPYEDAWGGGHE